MADFAFVALLADKSVTRVNASASDILSPSAMLSYKSVSVTWAWMASRVMTPEAIRRIHFR